MKIDNRRVGYDSPCFIVAEACDNHMGSMNIAKEMVLQAKLAGADAIKFQHHLPDEEMLKDVPMSDNFDEPLYEFLKRHALTLQQHRDLRDFCEKTAILYMCTPFSFKAAVELDSIGISSFKIGSGEMTDLPSLRKIAALGKPMIVSTGMSTFEEIDETYELLKNAGSVFALLNCASEYPPAYEDINLRVIPEMIKRYPEAVIGHSDHTSDIYTSFAALTLGAKIIEKHVILDKNTRGPDQSVSIDMMDLQNMVHGIRKIELALGSEKRLHERERPIRTWAFRSVVAVRDIRQGEEITPDSVWSKRPGTGIPSKRMNEIIGRTAIRNIQNNTLIRWEDLE